MTIFFHVIPFPVLRTTFAALRLSDPSETRAKMGAKLLASLTQGMSEDSFWSVFVQCLRCKDVFLRESFANSHWSACPLTRTVITTPYGRPSSSTPSTSARARKPRVLRSVLGYAIADIAEEFPMASTPIGGRDGREPSPTPTIRHGSEEASDPFTNRTDNPEAPEGSTYSGYGLNHQEHEAEANTAGCTVQASDDSV